MLHLVGHSTPVYDISKHYQTDDIRDLLIRNVNLGKSLASCFGAQGPCSSPGQNEPGQAVALMRGHGYTIIAPSIEQCVFRAIYTKENAVIQTASLGLSFAYHGNGGTASDIRYLDDDEIPDATAMSQSAWSRAWGLWVREVEAANLYVKPT